MVVTVGEWRDGRLVNPVEVCIEEHGVVEQALQAAELLDEADDCELRVGDVDVCYDTPLRPGDVLRMIRAEEDFCEPMTVEARLERLEREAGLPIPRVRS